MSAAKIKQIYKRVLKEKKADFICLAKNYDQVLGGWYDRDFAPRLKASGIKVREILRENWKGELTETDLIVTPGFAALISFDPKNPTVVVIEEPNIVAFVKNIFKKAWKSK